MTTIKERPILFSGAMVRALLAGSKTQTRREVKLTHFMRKEQAANYESSFIGKQETGIEGFVRSNSWQLPPNYEYCPYGQPGERLWVRENFQAFVPGTWAMVMKLDQTCVTAFQATEAERATEFNDTPWGGPWRPSTHMPRRLSRLLLEIVAVRVERLQDISEADAVAEGIQVQHFIPYEVPEPVYKCYTDKTGDVGFGNPVASYESLWASINGPDSWEANPFVWVVEFKVIAGKEVASC